MRQYTLRTAYQSIHSSYSNDDLDWVQFVKDHYSHIRSRSSIVELDPFRHNTMQYRLRDFLLENNIPVEMDWIILLINQLGSDMEFSNLNILLIPDTSDISHLRDIFDTTQAHKRRIINESTTF